MFTSLSLSPTWEKDSQHLLHAPVEINPGFWTSPVPYFGCKLGLFDQPSSKTFQPQLLKSQICCNQFLLVSKKNPSEKKNLNPLQTSISNLLSASKPTQKNMEKNLQSRHQPLKISAIPAERVKTHPPWHQWCVFYWTFFHLKMPPASCLALRLKHISKMPRKKSSDLLRTFIPKIVSMKWHGNPEAQRPSSFVVRSWNQPISCRN